MTDFFQLEKQCKQIRLKKIKKIFLYILSIIVLIIASIFSYNYFTKQPKKVIHKSKPIIKQPKPISQPKKIEKPKPKPIPQPKKVVKTIQKPKSILQDETISFDKAIKLAQLYYNNADYENSIKWCKMASKIDNNDEQVWKLYALNLEKIGQKQKSIKVLKTYLKYKPSLELKYLLERLEK